MISLQHALYVVGAYVVLSSFANALDPNDKTIFGTLRRFLLLLTNNPLVKAELSAAVPMLPSVQPQKQE